MVEIAQDPVSDGRPAWPLPLREWISRRSVAPQPQPSELRRSFAPSPPRRFARSHRPSLVEQLRAFWREPSASCEPVAEPSAWAPTIGDRLDGGPADPSAPPVVLLDAAGVILGANEAWRLALPTPAAGESPTRAGQLYLEVCRANAVAPRPEAFRRGVQDVLAGRAGAFTHRFTSESEGRRQVRITPLSVGPSPLFVSIHDAVCEIADEAEQRD
ncbi:MAG: hypothetical protein ABW042_05030, partial [Phenylobacterium sp.]